MRRARPLILALLSCAVFGGAAHAHQRDTSSIELRDDGALLHLTIDVDPHDLPVADRTDVDRDGRLDAAERLEAEALLRALVVTRTKAAAVAGECTQHHLTTGFSEQSQLWRAELTLACPGTAAAFGVYFGYIDAAGRGHRALAHIESDGARRSVVLEPRRAGLPPRAQMSGTQLWAFIKLGAHHLWTGVDHMIFVAALMLTAGTLRRVFWRLTAFTLAHSLTLGLALGGLVDAPPAIIEPLIAASIGFAPLIDVSVGRRRQWLVPLVSFAFGLLHGLGFAAALDSAHLQEAHLGLVLLGFNLGLELAQLALATLLLPLTLRLPERWQRPLAVVFAVEDLVGGSPDWC